MPQDTKSTSKKVKARVDMQARNLTDSQPLGYCFFSNLKGAHIMEILMDKINSHLYNRMESNLRFS